jgi:hypothetical protein
MNGNKTRKFCSILLSALVTYRKKRLHRSWVRFEWQGMVAASYLVLLSTPPKLGAVVNTPCCFWLLMPGFMQVFEDTVLKKHA